MNLTGYVPDAIHGPIPRDLERLVSLLNTAGTADGEDELADLPGLVAWLGPGSARGATKGDLEVARGLRGGLRVLAAANCGEPLDEAAVAEVARWTARLPVSVQLVGGGSAIVVGGTGAGRVLGEVMAAYARAVETGRWRHVKLCASPSCRWTFWDGSKNGSRKWCAMRLCGSRSKMRAYRRRAHAAERAGYAGDGAARPAHAS
jgi:predicted RNA-binding Zn ribbon-like protein